jgi:diacylglycerol kinase family enzyme
VHGFLIVNPRSGSGRPTADELVAAAREADIEAHVLAEGEDPAELAGAAGADALGVAGGDGTLAAVAAVAVERGLPFVCVPFGTRNHFARDVGLDRDDPLGALAAFSSGRETRVDVGRANGRLFLNNVSLGLYARFVRRGLLRALGRTPVETYTVDGARVETRVLLLSNNPYELGPLDVGVRERLDTGRIALYVARGLLPGSWESREAERFVLERPGGLAAAVDGEPERFDSPLEVAVEPRALRILLP